MTALQNTMINYILPIAIFFTIAYGVHRVSRKLVRRFQPLGDLTMRNNPRRHERQITLQALFSNAISLSAFVVASVLSLALFVSLDSLIWVIGLFSAAFGLGARPFISDFLTGLSFMFEDSFDVGDKIEFPLSPQRIEGVVEAVSLRVTRVRGMEGELFTMPNGDIRVIRNFSRGEFSPTDVTLKVPAAELAETLDKLESLAEDAMTRLPNLIEPWQVISKSGELGDLAELTILAKAKFGKGAEMRPRMLAFLQSELHTSEVTVQEEQAQPSSDAVVKRDEF